ncbi:exodeoxyribonuclease VII large subunit [Shewanella sp. NIFS-20-20]|uniref:exodeoxyribonuclease VII large subunit n=1 Tax=Shewanella sp. NIFS-20-20 TaxID=2853806 RepID=UPI001C4841B5|nr:exodeoxyribonuclease VII large subunit [Shewanella sp. NIFS-20-20]MBV7317148.1 exodeoxyribonuclease VII large subunit [Shewanella sp. NIFS-20-20]
METIKKDIYTVSKLNGEVRQLLEGNLSRIWLTAEISNFSAPASGHWYLTLKDSRSQIRCAMFKGKNQSVNFRPSNGQQVLVRGNISVYEPRGDYQLLIDSMQMAGDGLLAAQYEMLKNKLAAAGLFAHDTKRALPNNIQRIGVITSPTGAAIRDVLHVLQRRDAGLEVVIYPAQVQGDTAPAQLIRAIELANQRQEVDVLLLTRGGGSLEDLWCFNDEALAHAIYQSNLVVVSAVGHEVDSSISDYIADIRAATPSAAAELLSKDKQHKQQHLQQLSLQLSRAWHHHLQGRSQHLGLLEQKLYRQDPKRRLQQLSQQFDEAYYRLHTAMTFRLNQIHLTLQQQHSVLMAHSPQHTLQLQVQQLEYLQHTLQQRMAEMLSDSEQRLSKGAQLLAAVSPLATLKRGYSITTDEQGNVIDDAANLTLGQTVHSRLNQGQMVATVTHIIP